MNFLAAAHAKAHDGPRHWIRLWISGDLSVQRAGQLRLQKQRPPEGGPEMNKVAAAALFSLRRRRYALSP
jgi:hypothetical protein